MIAIATRCLRGAGGGGAAAEAKNLSERLESVAKLGFHDLGWGLHDFAPGHEPSREVMEKNLFRVVSVSDFTPHGDAGIPADPAADGLASLDEEVRLRAVRAIRTRAGEARKLGCAVIVTRLGAVDLPGREEREARARRDRKEAEKLVAEVRERAERILVYACRSLHEICRAEPDVAICVENPALGYELGGPNDLERVIDDVRSPNLGAWFASGSADLLFRAGLGPDPAAFLEPIARHLRGAHLSDAHEGTEGRPPGEGSADFKMVSFFLPRRARRVLYLAPGARPEQIRQSVDYLSSRGLS